MAVRSVPLAGGGRLESTPGDDGLLALLALVTLAPQLRRLDGVGRDGAILPEDVALAGAVAVL